MGFLWRKNIDAGQFGSGLSTESFYTLITATPIEVALRYHGREIWILKTEAFALNKVCLLNVLGPFGRGILQSETKACHLIF